jgi:hypothetical protein
MSLLQILSNLWHEISGNFTFKKENQRQPSFWYTEGVHFVGEVRREDILLVKYSSYATS